MEILIATPMAEASEIATAYFAERAFHASRTKAASGRSDRARTAGERMVIPSGIMRPPRGVAWGSSWRHRTGAVGRVP